MVLHSIKCVQLFWLKFLLENNKKMGVATCNHVSKIPPPPIFKPNGFFVGLSVVHSGCDWIEILSSFCNFLMGVGWENTGRRTLNLNSYSLVYSAGKNGDSHELIWSWLMPVCFSFKCHQQAFLKQILPAMAFYCHCLCTPLSNTCSYLYYQIQTILWYNHSIYLIWNHLMELLLVYRDESCRLQLSKWLNNIFNFYL
jgi:hypothetical protein